MKDMSYEIVYGNKDFRTLCDQFIDIKINELACKIKKENNTRQEIHNDQK